MATPKVENSAQVCPASLKFVHDLYYNFLLEMRLLKHQHYFSAIRFSEDESGSHWQQKDYKTLSPTINENPDYSKFPAIQVSML
jgi:hypothetical protein